MNYSKINESDIANGPGVRVSLFVSGCRHHCKNCFNQVTWDFKHGELFTNKEIESIINRLKFEYIEGLTILGGEPMEPENQSEVFHLISQVREFVPNKSIWLYTGCLFEDLLNKSDKYHTSLTLPILSMTDVLVDGLFIEKLKDLRLKFKGSSNQRLINSMESIKCGKLILNDLNF